MKKLSSFLVFILIFSLLFFMISCSTGSKAEDKQVEKRYRITTYTVDWNRVNLFKSAISSDIAKAVLEDDLIKNNTTTEFYTAKEIISFSETSVRFIDVNGTEKFISADYIQVVEF